MNVTTQRIIVSGYIVESVRLLHQDLAALLLSMYSRFLINQQAIPLSPNLLSDFISLGLIPHSLLRVIYYKPMLLEH